MILTDGAKDILRSDWIAPTIVDRTQQIKELNTNYFNSIINEEIPTFNFVCGSSGTGKTFVIKRMIQDGENEFRKHLPTFEYIYINMGETQIPSAYTLWFLVAKHLEKYLPINDVKEIPIRGYSSDYYTNLVQKIIEEKQLAVTLVVDEVDKIVNKEGNDTILYQLAYFYKRIEKSPRYVGLGAIAISNDLFLLNKITEPTRQRIPVRIHFSSYTAQDLFEILKTHAEFSLKEESYTDEDLMVVAKNCYDHSTSARKAKMTLYNLGEISEKKLDVNKVQEAINKTKEDLMLQEIKLLPFHHTLALYSVIKKHERIENMMHSPVASKGLFRYSDNLPTKKSIYDVYQKTCNHLKEQARGYKTFFNTIDELESKGLLLTGTQALGRARGLVTFIKLSESLDMMKNIFKRLGYE